MKTVSAREANQAFSQLLAEVAEGEEVVITRHGRPVARMVPVQGRAISAERQQAIDRMMAHLREGLPLGGRKFTRDEMHER